MGGAWCKCGTGDRLRRTPPPPPPTRVLLPVFIDPADLSRASEEGLDESPPPFAAEGERESFRFGQWAVAEEAVEDEFTFWLPAGVRTALGGDRGELASERRPRGPPSSPPVPPPPPPICLPPTTMITAGMIMDFFRTKSDEEIEGVEASVINLQERSKRE